LAFQGRPFQLCPTDADRLIQVRSDSVMWQKERLLNIGLDHLPDACEAVAWLDSDVLFVNDGWIPETLQRLERYPIVQPYEAAVRLPRRAATMNLSILPLGSNEAERDPGVGFLESRGALRGTAMDGHGRPGHCGFAWCGRRELFQRHRFYDRAVVGSGDLYMAAAFLNRWREVEMPTDAMQRDYHHWAEAVALDVRARITYTPGTLLHCWHGHRGYRFYAGRRRLLTWAAFDPAADLALNGDRCWEWNSSKPALHRAVRHYFFLRNEEGSLWRFLRAVLREPVFAGRALFGTWRARFLGWLRPRVIGEAKVRRTAGSHTNHG
ncbi:MAG: hypothetical protein A3C53_04130, partial [Omnitrophica WOR_2 bacterium RIFCSPHIGHO2_02_FULL_68_15]